MSRYIDADNAIERLGAYLMTNAQIEYSGLASEDIDDWKPIAIDILKGAPSIELVRCAECKWAKANGTYQWCGRLDSTARITADDFCSRRKERASDDIYRRNDNK